MAQWETSCAGTLCIRTCASRLMIRGQLQVKILPGGGGLQRYSLSGVVVLRQHIYQYHY